MKVFRINLSNWQINIIVFILLSLIVSYLHFTFFKPALGVGMTPDDWSLYFTYKTFGQNPLTKITQVWHERGAYTTYQFYYIGLLEKFVGFNYQTFHTVNLIFKILATLAIFPLCLVIFKHLPLAFLAALLYTISPASAGPLEFVVKGSDYLAIFWMSLFLITYYLLIRRRSNNIPLLILSFLVLILTITFSPIRLYPLLIIVPFVEIFLIIKKYSANSVKRLFVRLTVLYLPFILLIIYSSPNSILGYLLSPLSIFKEVIKGNWHLVLSPLSGMGHTFITNEYWEKIFGYLTVTNFQNYLAFIMGGPTVIFSVLTAIVAFLKAKNRWNFFLFVFSLNFTVEAIIFFVATHYKLLPINQGLHYEPTGLYSALFGTYILILGLFCFIEWIKKGRQDLLLMALWIGASFLFIFTWATWIFAPFGTGFSSTSYYLVVSSIGTSIFIGAFLTSIYDHINNLKVHAFRLLAIPLISLVIMLIFLMDRKDIQTYFANAKNSGRFAQGQQMIQNKFRQKVKDIDFSKPVLFYFDTSDISGDGRFYTESFLSSFPFWMHIQGTQLIDGCVEVFYEDRNKLAKLIKVKDGEKGFVYRGLCVENGKGGYKEIFYPPESFYAFKLKNRDFIDIKKDLLKELGI